MFYQIVHFSIKQKKIEFQANLVFVFIMLYVYVDQKLFLKKFEYSCLTVILLGNKKNTYVIPFFDDLHVTSRIICLELRSQLKAMKNF